MGKNRGSQLDSYLGDVKQTLQALYHLINGADVVFIEKEDDISVLNKSNQVLLVEQLKDKFDNIFTDYSEDFWNTLYNWVVDWRDGHSNFTDDTKFILFSNNKEHKKGEFIDKCHNAKTEQEAKDAWDYIENKFKSTNENIKNQFKEIKKAENKNNLYKIIKNFQCKHPQISLIDDLDELINENYKKAFPENIESFKDAIYRWFHNKVYDDATKKIRVCKINKDDLNEFHSYFAGQERKLKLSEKEDIDCCLFENTKNCLFIKQHRIIGHEKDIIDPAHRDFLAWDILKCQELQEGLVTQEQFNKSYQAMHEIWAENKSSINDLHIKKPEEAKARLLYSKCLDEKVKISGVDFECAPKRAARGLYNYLANEELSSELSIGWHPDYKNILKNCEEGNE